MKFYDNTNKYNITAEPFMVKVDGLELPWDRNAVPFVITNNGVYFGSPESEHNELEAHLGLDQRLGKRAYIEGRFWTKAYVVAFWGIEALKTEDFKKLSVALRKRLHVDPEDVTVFLDYAVGTTEQHPFTTFIVEMTLPEACGINFQGNMAEYFYSQMKKQEEPKRDEKIADNGMLNKDIWRHYQNVGESKLREVVEDIVRNVLEEVRYLNPNFVPEDDNELERQFTSWCQVNGAQNEKLQEKNGVLIFKLDLQQDENERELATRLKKYFFPRVSVTLKKKGPGIFLIGLKNFEQEAPVKDSESVRVYHGTDIPKALVMATKGFSGKERIQRVYSDEAWNNPAGLFVTINFDRAKYFATNNSDAVILEFSAKAADLDRPVWGGDTHSYVTYGGVSGVFRNKAERQAEKRRQYNDAMTSNYSYVKDSDSPAMVQNLTTGMEQQALYFGDVEPNMIKRFWVKEGKSFVPYTRKDFLSKYAGKQSYLDADRKQEYKLYSPTENYVGIEDFARRWDKKYPDSKGTGEEFLNGIWEKMGNNNGEISYSDSMALKQIMWPKQLEQFLTTGGYQQNIDNMYPEFRQSGKPW